MLQDEDASPRGLKKALNAEKDARQEISRACTETPLTDDNPMDESPAAAVDE